MDNQKVLFLSSSGGHLTQLLKLRPLFEKYDYKIMTDRVESTSTLEEKYNVSYWGGISKGRSIGMALQLLKLTFYALKEFIFEKPDVIVTTGAYPAVPFCYIAKLFNIKVIYILSFARVETKSLSADLLYKVSDLFVVQWKECLKNYPDGEYLGEGLY